MEITTGPFLWLLETVHHGDPSIAVNNESPLDLIYRQRITMVYRSRYGQKKGQIV